MLFYPAPLHRIQEDVANCLSNGSKACAGLLKKLSRPKLSASSLSELSTGHPLVPRSSRFFNRISKVSLNPHDRWASYASDKRSQKDNTQIGKWLESVLPSKTAARLRDWGLDASFREFDKGCFTVSQRGTGWFSRSVGLMSGCYKSDQTGMLILWRGVVHGFGNSYWRSSAAMKLLSGRTNSASNAEEAGWQRGIGSDFNRVHRWFPLHATCGFKPNLYYANLTGGRGHIYAKQRKSNKWGII